MTDYSQLVKDARFAINYDGCSPSLVAALADAIDALQARVAELEAGLREIQSLTTEHGGAAKALRIIRDLLERKPS